MTIRKMVTAKRARDIDESTLSTAPEDCLRNFPNLKEIRKEQKTCLLNLARGKDFGDARPSAAAIEKFEDVKCWRFQRFLCFKKAKFNHNYKEGVKTTVQKA